MTSTATLDKLRFPADLTDELADVASDEGEEEAMLFDGLVPRDSVGLLVGCGGAGKGRLVIDMAARLALGLPFAGHETAGPGNSIIVSFEDSERSLKRRVCSAFRAAERDLPAGTDRGEAFEQMKSGMQVYSLRGSSARHVDDVLACIESAAARFSHGVDLIVIDPLSDLEGAYDGNSFNGREARDLLGKLDRLAKRTGALVLGVAHTRKAANSAASGRATAWDASGAGELVNRARWVAVLYPDHDARAESKRCGLIVDKANDMTADRTEHWFERDAENFGALVHDPEYRPKRKAAAPAPAEIEAKVLAAVDGRRTKDAVLRAVGGTKAAGIRVIDAMIADGRLRWPGRGHPVTLPS